MCLESRLGRSLYGMNGRTRGAVGFTKACRVRIVGVHFHTAQVAKLADALP